MKKKMYYSPEVSTYAVVMSGVLCGSGATATGSDMESDDDEVGNPRLIGKHLP